MNQANICTAQQIVFHTPTQGTTYVSPCNIPMFHVDRRQAAGEVGEQRILARVTLVQNVRINGRVLYSVIWPVHQVLSAIRINRVSAFQGDVCNT